MRREAACCAWQRGFGVCCSDKNFEKWYVLVYILIGFFLKTFEKLTFSYKNNDFTWSLAIEY